MKGRVLKQDILRLLSAQDFNQSLDRIRRLPARQAVNPLFSCLYRGDTLLKWRAVTAMGTVVADLFERNPESARVVIRRLIWNLNDESGGIGWGSPEAMGDILARSADLASEYACILISYIDPSGNYLEHETLQRGVLWGIGRLAHARPRFISGALVHLVPFLSSNDPFHRGLAAWAVGAAGDPSLEQALVRLTRDAARIEIYLGGKLVRRSVGELTARGRKDTS
jgi:hypothetical protein